METLNAISNREARHISETTGLSIEDVLKVANALFGNAVTKADVSKFKTTKGKSQLVQFNEWVRNNIETDEKGNSYVTIKQLWESYLNSTNGEPLVTSPSKLSRLLASRGFQRHRVLTSRGFIGITLKN